MLSKKKLYSAAVILMSPAMLWATPKITGFVDTVFVAVDDITPSGSLSPIQYKFVTTGEIDFDSVIGEKTNVRLDVDLSTTGATLEQAYGSYKFTKVFGMKAGMFNNPVGWEAEDAPELFHINHGLIYQILDSQTTTVAGNNLTGFALTVDTNEVKFAGGQVNELSDENEKISLFAAGSFKFGSSGLELEAGAVTQNANLETLVDVNLTFKQGPLTVAGEVLLPGEVVDMAVGGTANFQFTSKFSGTARYERVNFDSTAVDDASVITLAGTFALNSNIFINAELQRIDVESDPTNSFFILGERLLGEGNLVSLELIAHF